MPIPRIMGVVNVTPDSFSDGGQFFDPARAVAHGLELVAQGANLLDVGGESTRPGAEPVGVAQEISRVVPVIERLRTAGVPISIDTLKPEVARAAVAAGASIWNDVTSLSGPGALEAAAEFGCSVVLMHMQGEPRTMQDAPRYGDVVGEVEAYLLARAEAAVAAGIARDKVWIDPGIGFGKTLAHNLDLLRNLGRLAGHGFPLLLGVSRKSFLKGIDASALEASERLGGSLAAALWGASQGAAILRVHDVRETCQALATWAAIQG